MEYNLFRTANKTVLFQHGKKRYAFKKNKLRTATTVVQPNRNIGLCIMHE